MNLTQSVRMIGIVVTILFLMFSLVSAATLNWGASSGDVNGYIIYYGTTPSSISGSVNVGNVTSYSIDKLPLKEEVQYHFYVTAYNEAGESVPCDSVAYTTLDSTPPMPPSGLKTQ